MRSNVFIGVLILGLGIMLFVVGLRKRSREFIAEVTR